MDGKRPHDIADLGADRKELVGAFRVPSVVAAQDWADTRNPRLAIRR